MKKKLLSMLLVGLVPLAATSTAIAACGSTACDGKIETVYFTNNGTVYIGTDGDENSLNCSAVAGVYITIPTSNPDQKTIYATILTAKATDQNTVVRIKEGSSNCELDWIRLDP